MVEIQRMTILDKLEFLLSWMTGKGRRKNGKPGIQSKNFYNSGKMRFYWAAIFKACTVFKSLKPTQCHWDHNEEKSVRKMYEWCIVREQKEKTLKWGFWIFFFYLKLGTIRAIRIWASGKTTCSCQSCICKDEERNRVSRYGRYCCLNLTDSQYPVRDYSDSVWTDLTDPWHSQPHKRKQLQYCSKYTAEQTGWVSLTSRKSINATLFVEGGKSRRRVLV